MFYFLYIVCYHGEHIALLLFVVVRKRLVYESVIQPQPDPFQHYHAQPYQHANGHVSKEIRKDGGNDYHYAYISQGIPLAFLLGEIIEIIREQLFEIFEAEVERAGVSGGGYAIAVEQGVEQRNEHGKVHQPEHDAKDR